MDFKKVSLSFNADKEFKETGVPFKLKAPSELKWTKDNKQYREDYEDLVSMCSGIDLSDLGKAVNVSGDSIQLNFEVSKGVSRTFKFLGMDINEDLDAVIVGSFGTVFVGNLSNSAALKVFITKKMANESINAEKVVAGITKDGIRGSVEALKFKNLMSLPTQMDAGDVQVFSDGLGWFDFLDNLLNDVKEVKDSGYSSIILNFLSGALDKADESWDDEALKKAIYMSVSSWWHKLIERYILISKLLSAFDLFFKVRKNLVGLETTINDVKSSVTEGEYGDVGCFEGFSRAGAVDGRTFNCNIASSFMKNVSELFLYKNITFEAPIGMVMSTMYNYPNHMDITKMNKKSHLSLSVLDGLKYSDPDLEYVTSSYDMADADEQELLFRNIIGGYKKKFNTYLNDSGLDIEDEIIKNAIPNDASSQIDILNILKTQVPEKDVDVEVSKVSFNLTNLLKACRLIYKVTDELTQDFKSNV
jgi:hypothetical protein